MASQLASQSENGSPEKWDIYRHVLTYQETPEIGWAEATRAVARGCRGAAKGSVVAAAGAGGRTVHAEAPGQQLGGLTNRKKAKVSKLQS